MATGRPGDYVNRTNTRRQLAHQYRGLARPERHQLGACVFLGHSPERADDARLQWKLQGLCTGHLNKQAIAYSAGRATGKGMGRLGSVVAHYIEARPARCRHCGLRTTQKRRAELHAVRTEGKGGGDPLYVGDAAPPRGPVSAPASDLRHRCIVSTMPAPGLSLKLPRWPPASNPRAMTTSAPSASSELKMAARFLES